MASANTEAVLRPSWVPKRDELIGYRKPDDILALCEALNIELTDRGDYCNGPCPLHHHERNHQTLVVYPNRGEGGIWSCLSCHPRWSDSIGLWMAVKNVPFWQAVNEICTRLSDEDALLKKIRATGADDDWFDHRHLAERMHRLFDHLEFSTAFRVIQQMDDLLEQGQRAYAERILRGYEI